MLQVSRIYPTTTDSYVRSHQLWAACTLWQSTGKTEYWDDAKTIYTTFIRKRVGEGESPPAEFAPYQLYDPVANYYNPIWWGMLCMAQSAPEYTGLEEQANITVPRQITADGDTVEQFTSFLLQQEFGFATRAEATQQIWEQFVLPWITYDGALTQAAARRITSVAFACCVPCCGFCMHVSMFSPEDHKLVVFVYVLLEHNLQEWACCVH
jgi:hypothetical protein